MQINIVNTINTDSILTLNANTIFFDGIEPNMVHVSDDVLLVVLPARITFYVVRSVNGALSITNKPWRTGKVIFDYNPQIVEVN